MSLLVIVLTLLIEQARPLAERRVVLAPLTRVARYLERHFNDGQDKNGKVAWCLGVLLPVVLVAAVGWLLQGLSIILGFLFAVGVLYLTMGFRQCSHYFTDIHQALRSGDVEQARLLLAEWRSRSGIRLSSSEVARLTIEEALVASHQHVYAPIFWFVVLGPAGALLYRLALFFRTQWVGHAEVEVLGFSRFAEQAFRIIDWLPLRLTAIGFAIVGDFEDAVYCWRTQAALWPDRALGVLLASGAGAMGVKLGQPVHDDLGDLGERPELGVGEEADADFMQSAIGLVWRTLILALLLLGLLWLGAWVGRV